MKKVQESKVWIQFGFYVKEDDLIIW
jgi:hypothetical protein